MLLLHVAMQISWAVEETTTRPKFAQSRAQGELKQRTR